MPTTKPLCILLSLSMLSGCASMGMGSGYVPMVDMQGRSQEQFDSDLRDCQGMAASQQRTAALAVAGAVIFGVVGAVLATRGFKTDAAEKLAIVGAGTGAADGIGRQQDIVRRCLAGRGYSVLN